MKNSSLKSKVQTTKKLQSKLRGARKVQNSDDFIRVKVKKSQARFKRIRRPKARDIGHGEFFLLLDITALEKAVYVPISIASGKRATGFIYHIEGTAAGDIYTTDISCRGEGITKVTLGTLLYAKIPAGKGGSFRMLIEMRGRINQKYKIVINRINYKLDPRDARYKRFNTEIGTKTKKFS